VNLIEILRGLESTLVKERILWTYAGTFNNITKGYAAAKPMYERGAVAVDIGKHATGSRRVHTDGYKC
jgi:hypothetical protein